MKERQILTNCLGASPTFSGVIFPPPPLKCGRGFGSNFIRVIDSFFECTCSQISQSSPLPG